MNSRGRILNNNVPTNSIVFILCGVDILGSMVSRHLKKDTL
jgi:hypothetical protein